MKENVSDDDDELWADLEEHFKDFDLASTTDYSQQPTPFLIDTMDEALGRLKKMKQRLAPRTQEARDLHSVIYACRTELKRRGLYG